MIGDVFLYSYAHLCGICWYVPMRPCILLGVMVSSHQWCTECGITSYIIILYDVLTGKLILSYLSLSKGSNSMAFGQFAEPSRAAVAVAEMEGEALEKALVWLLRLWAFQLSCSRKATLEYKVVRRVRHVRLVSAQRLRKFAFKRFPLLRHATHSYAPRWTWRRCLWHWRPQTGGFWSSGQVVKGRTGGSDSRDHCHPKERVNMDQ